MPEIKSALDLANDMAMLYAQMFKHEPDSYETIESARRSVKIMAKLRGIPADALDQIAKLRERVQKLEARIRKLSGTGDTWP